MPPLDVPGLLRQYQVRPDKRLGQNFLVDTVALRRVVEAAGILPGEAVLEVGPGLGSLTRYLAVLAREVVAVELDASLIPPLGQVLSPYPNVRIVQGDILALDPVALMAGSAASHLNPQTPSSQPYLVVANIPYYITSALIRHLLEARLPPARLTLTVQREVAARIAAGPGEMSLLALSVQVYGRPQILARIPAGAFYPSPNVDSAVIRVDLYPTPLIPYPQLDAFFRLAKAGFSQKRKTLRNALSGGMHWSPTQAAEFLQTANIDPRRRAETLSLDEWRNLVEKINMTP
jgi:16S rRNA (adenine1518-N6/adenine1519-N6)-dimethyltransferase